MKNTILTAVTCIAMSATWANAQEVVAVAAPTTTATAGATTLTGFTPLAGAALGAAGPLVIGLGAIIAIGAIAGGTDTQ